jgi:hypothetical protein
MEPKWGLDLAINGNRWKQTANDDLIKSVCYLPLFAVVFRYLPTLLPTEKVDKFCTNINSSVSCECKLPLLNLRIKLLVIAIP